MCNSIHIKLYDHSPPLMLASLITASPREFSFIPFPFKHPISKFFLKKKCPDREEIKCLNRRIHCLG